MRMLDDNKIYLAVMDKLILSLLKEELKCRKLSNLLHQIGVEECIWLPSLNEAIAELLELETDEDFQEYDELMSKYADQLKNEAISDPLKLDEIVRHIRNFK